jgi:hypothetical protein
MRTDTYRSGSRFAPIFLRRSGRGHWRAELLAAVLGVVAPVVTHASIVGFGDFSQFTINKNDSGSAPTFPASGTIQLVNGSNEARSIFFNTPQAVSQFTASFTYQVINGAQNEGADLVLQNDPAGKTAVGSGIHGFGGITNTVILSLDIGNNNTGVFSNSNGGGTGPDASPVVFASGHPIDVRLAYDGTTATEHLLDTVTSASFSNSFNVSIPTGVGGSTAYVGLTAGSGPNSVNQLFSNFQFTNTVPEPSGFALLATVAGWSLSRRRKRSSC